MPKYTRYAVYYVPPQESALAKFGAAWLGWDSSTGQDVPHPRVCGLDVAAITETPRKYGFHGTLKPPFRLADGTDADGVAASVETLSQSIAPFEAPPLTLKSLGFFLALVPSASSPSLSELAARCIKDLDAFRAPPNAAELAKRRSAGLNARQEAYLAEWGYPYILDEFRFHLTLSGRLQADELQVVSDVLTPMTTPLCQDPMPVTELGLLGELDGGRFHLIHRYPLMG